MGALGFGVIGTGGIAADFTVALRGNARCRVVNVAGSSFDKARAFVARFGVDRAARDLDALLDDPEVGAVYVASPHPAHEAHALACIARGKHVLCEKPMTTDADSTQRVIQAAAERGVFLMEAFMYRCHPMIGDLLRRLSQGEIGKISHVRADFGFEVPRDPRGRLFSPALGGGSILDVGGYPVSFARLIAGVVAGKPFDEPISLSAWGHLGPTGVDELAGALLTFASGFTAEVTSAVAHAVGTTAVVFGELGRVVLPNPWIPGGERQGRRSEFTVYRDGREPEIVTFLTEQAIYAIEAEVLAASLPALEPAWPAMSWADTIGNMRVMDAWRKAIEPGRSASPL